MQNFTMVLHLLKLFTLIAGVHSLVPEEVFVKKREMVVLTCRKGNSSLSGTEILWKKEDKQGMHFYNLSEPELRKIGIVLHGNQLVILNASANHQGNYACDFPSQVQFILTVCTEQSTVCEETSSYPVTCYKDKLCRLNCPNTLFTLGNITNMTENGILWNKWNGEPLKVDPYLSFERANSQVEGVYECIRSFMYYGQIYNKSFSVPLQIKNGKLPTYGTISSPKNHDVIEVELGVKALIDCTARIDSEDLLFWMIGDSFVDYNNTSRIFYNFTYDEDTQTATATLVFTEVLQEDLSNNYSCKLLSSSQPPEIVNIRITRKAQFSYVPMVRWFIIILVVTTVTVVIYIKFKVEIILFLREHLGWGSSTSDGKNYDAFLMCYKSNTDGGMNEYDRTWLENTLEEKFGYSLCLLDRDVLPGTAMAEAILNCIEESRTVILVPSSSEPELESSLLNVIHAALVEKKTRLIFIKTEGRGESKSGSLPEALQLLCETGKNCVTWEGRPPSSSFWKRLRYYLPTAQCAQKRPLLPHTSRKITSY